MKGLVLLFSVIFSTAVSISALENIQILQRCQEICHVKAHDQVKKCHEQCRAGLINRLRQHPNASLKSRFNLLKVEKNVKKPSPAQRIKFSNVAVNGRRVLRTLPAFKRRQN